jgi:F0F1-type ATP synthase assembly protein I
MINSEEDQNKKDVNNFAKYSGMAFQMLVTIGLFTFIGYQIDKRYKRDQPLFTALLGFVGVVVSLFMIIRSLTKNK